MADVREIKLMVDNQMATPITIVDSIKNLDGTKYKDTVSNELAGKAPSAHTHDDRYYTESEIDSKVSALNSSIAGKANSLHSHIAYSTSVTKNSGSRITLPSCTAAGEIRLVRVSNLGMGNFDGYIDLYTPSGGNYMVLQWGYGTSQGGSYNYQLHYDNYFAGNTNFDHIGVDEGESITTFYCLYAKIS